METIGSPTPQPTQTAPQRLATRFPTPPTPPGQEVGPPDFVGIGAQKAGTSRWHMLISEHPSVHASLELHPGTPEFYTKERQYFSPFFQHEFGDAEIADYHRWFPRPPGTVVGEWTPRYSVDPWVAPLLARAAPDARLLLMVRDPVARFISGMAHAERHEQLHPSHAVEHLTRGFYAAQLAHWRQHFPADRILVIQHERTVVDPRAELRRTLRFLELPEVEVDEGLFERPVNARRSGTRYELTDHLRAALVDRYAEDVVALAAMTDHLDLSLWPNFAHLQRAA